MKTSTFNRNDALERGGIQTGTTQMRKKVTGKDAVFGQGALATHV